MAAERGWSLLPVRKDKRPALKSWKEFQEKPATVKQLEKWSNFAAVKGWAVVTGKVSGLVILDFDGEAGKKVLRDLKLRAHVQTGSGGAHVYFEHPGWHIPTLNSKTSGELKKRWPGLDIRADGGYAVCWGENDSGKYRWLRKAELEKLDKLPLPLRQFLHLAHPPEPQRPASNDTGQPSADLPGRLLDMAINMARAEGRNNAGFWYACQLRDNRVPEQLARGLMERYAASVPSTNTKGKLEPYTAAEAIASLAEAYRAAPRDPIPQKRQTKHKTALPKTTAADPPPATTTEQEEPYLDCAGNYRLTKSSMFYVRTNRDGSASRVRLSNFPAVITADIVKDDGESTTRAFKVHATVKGKPMDIIVNASDFPGMGWVVESLGRNANVYPNMKEHLRSAMQELSKESSEQYVYQHTGWTQIGGQPVYLHAGGGLGAAGPVPDLLIELDHVLSRFTLPDPPRGRELVRAIRASLGILDVAPDRVTIPIYCAIWRAVLGIVDVSIHLSGQTGSGKSQIAALAQQHFGAGLDAKHLPANWDSTANALQAICFHAKNALVVVDDFVPKGSASDVARIHREADRLLRAQGNHAGRQRMSADTRIRPPKTPRGLILSTGEDVPKGNSLRARLVVVEMDPQDMKWSLLTECQHHARSGLYSQAMAGFIQWIAPRLESIDQRIIDHLSSFREEWGDSGHHKRTPDNLANLSCGLEVFLDFCRDIGALTNQQAGLVWERSLVAFKEAAEAQDKEQSHAEPCAQFLDLVTAAFTSGQAHLVTRDGQMPDDAGMYGWSQAMGDWRPQGAKIGWVEGEDIYLQWKAAFGAAQKVGREIGDPIPVSINTLGKRLAQRRLLASTEAQREVNYVRKTCEGVRQCVWHFLRRVLYRGDSPAQPDQSF